MESIKTVIDTFWSPHFWLPPNVTWTDIEPNESIAYTNYRHLAIPLPLAFVLLGIRIVLEKYWFTPVALFMGVKNDTKVKKVIPNAILEKSYLTKGKKSLSHHQVIGLAKQLDWTERQVERWLRIRRAVDKPTTLVKICETSWRWFYYTCSFCLGIFCLWDKPWFWDINLCYHNYPHHGITFDCWCYYMMNLSFYWALTFSQFFDVKRKDFWQMFIHHILTITLLSFSWVCNLHQIGCVVLVIHDCADVFLEGAKFFKYANYQKTCDVIFAAFTILWIVTRCGFYPFWIIYSTSITAPTIVPMFAAYYFFNSLLIGLLILHVIWTYIIVRIAVTAVTAGKMDGDLRSSSSDEISEELNAPGENDKAVKKSK